MRFIGGNSITNCITQTAHNLHNWIKAVFKSNKIYRIIVLLIIIVVNYIFAVNKNALFITRWLNTYELKSSSKKSRHNIFTIAKRNILYQHRCLNEKFNLKYYFFNDSVVLKRMIGYLSLMRVNQCLLKWRVILF